MVIFATDCVLFTERDHSWNLFLARKELALSHWKRRDDPLEREYKKKVTSVLSITFTLFSVQFDSADLAIWRRRLEIGAPRREFDFTPFLPLSFSFTDSIDQVCVRAVR